MFQEEEEEMLEDIEDWEEESDNAEQRVKRHQFYLRCGLIDLPFKLKGNGMIFAVMSNSDAIDSEKCRAVIEGIMGAPVGNMEIVPR